LYPHTEFYEALCPVSSVPPFRNTAMPIVESGTPTTATLQVAGDASGTARLLIGSASAEGTKSDFDVIAPGTSGSVTITPVGFGIMRVHVDMGEEGDRGVLTVDPPGPHNESIQGDTNRRYTVVQ
jgi:hypothetical protein